MLSGRNRYATLRLTTRHSAMKSTDQRKRTQVTQCVRVPTSSSLPASRGAGRHNKRDRRHREDALRSEISQSCAASGGRRTSPLNGENTSVRDLIEAITRHHQHLTSAPINRVARHAGMNGALVAWPETPANEPTLSHLALLCQDRVLAFSSLFPVAIL